MRRTDAKRADISDLAKTLGGSGLVLVEIGSFMGESACVFAESGVFSRIICVDPWKDIPGKDGNSYTGMDKVEAAFDENTAAWPQIQKFKGTVDDFVGSEAFMQVQGKVDAVYIDGLHTYEGCSHDIDVCRRLIKPRVAYAGHDYTDKIAHVVGVKKAVDEAFGEPDRVFGDNSWIKFAG